MIPLIPILWWLGGALLAGGTVVVLVGLFWDNLRTKLLNLRHDLREKIFKWLREKGMENTRTFKFLFDFDTRWGELENKCRELWGQLSVKIDGKWFKFSEETMKLEDMPEEGGIQQAAKRAFEYGTKTSVDITPLVPQLLEH